VFTRKGNVGSNPTLSAKLLKMKRLLLAVGHVKPHLRGLFHQWNE
jgi:hypothetical protein